MAAPIVLPIAPWLPDLPDSPTSDQGSTTILNVYPRTKVSYGPINAPAKLYNALNARCQGGVGFRDSDGNVFIFAGDVNDLYYIRFGFAAWQNASKSPAAYNVNFDEQWQFIYFNGDVIGVNFNDNPQYFTLKTSSTFTDLPGDPPKGRYAAVVKNAFVVLGNTFDPVNGNMPQRIWWSAAGNAKEGGWPELGTDAAAQVQSGAVDLLGPGGWVQGFAADLINADAIIFMEQGVRRMTYAGPPDIFTFLPVENAKGTPCPYSIVVNGGIAYYWGQDGIYAFDGGASVPIGFGKVDMFLYGDGALVGDVDPNNLARVVGAADPLNKLIWWAYPSTQASNGNPDRLLIYNWQLDRFTLAAVTCETILRMLSIGYTLDELETVLGYPTLESIPAPLDWRGWTGGILQLSLFDTDHTMTVMTGPALQATIETSEMQPIPGRRTMVRSSRPLVDITAPGTVIAPTVSIGHRERLQDSVTYAQAVPLNSMGACPARTSGRYIRGTTVIPAGGGWLNFSGIEIEAGAQGSR